MVAPAGNNNYWIQNENSQIGSGVGILQDLLNGRVIATRYQDYASGDDKMGIIYGISVGGTDVGYGEHVFVALKITWGATEDIIEVYELGEDYLLYQPINPVSVLITDVDQSEFDTLTITKGGEVTVNEIRMGADL